MRNLWLVGKVATTSQFVPLHGVSHGESTNEDGLRAEWQVDKDETKTFNQKLGMLGFETTFFSSTNHSL